MHLSCVLFVLLSSKKVKASVKNCYVYRRQLCESENIGGNKAKKKKNPVLRARPTAFLPICRIFFFFFLQKNIIKSAIFSSKNFSEKMRAKRAENFWIYKRFLGQFGKKKIKKKKNSPDRPTAFWNLFARRTGFFFFVA